MVVKMIKKLLTVAAVLTLMPMTASADGVIDQSAADQSSSISVGHYVDASYTVTIPASVTFTDSEKVVERSLQASDVFLNEGAKLNVYVSSLNGFKMTNNEGYIEYYMMVNGHDIPQDSEVAILTVTAGDNSGWAVLRFGTELSDEHKAYAGNYSDTLTFTVKVE